MFEMRPDECPYELWDEKMLYSGRWLKTKEIRFKDKVTKHEGVWQSSHRTTKPEGTSVDGVDIIATLCKDGKRYFVFVKQYRIPMRGWCLEFPAGLIDDGESVEAAAIREMKEETGYTVTKVLHHSKGIQGLDPGLTDDSVQFVTVSIDGDLPENQTPTQNLGHSEAIEVILVECDNVMEFVEKNSEQLHVEAMVYTFAVGYNLAQKFAKLS